MSYTVQVFPEDKTIALNGIALIFDEPFPHEENLYYLTYQGDQHTGGGVIQFKDDYDMLITPAMFDEEIAPYIALWQEERAKRDKAEKEGQLEAERQRNNPEFLFIRLRMERTRHMQEYDNAISQLSRMERLAKTDEEKQKVNDLQKQWDDYAQALCDLPDKEGAPWDGGESEGQPNSVPWPQMPPQPKTLNIQK